MTRYGITHWGDVGELGVGYHRNVATAFADKINSVWPGKIFDDRRTNAYPNAPLKKGGVQLSSTGEKALWRGIKV